MAKKGTLCHAATRCEMLCGNFPPTWAGMQGGGGGGGRGGGGGGGGGGGEGEEMRVWGE